MTGSGTSAAGTPAAAEFRARLAGRSPVTGIVLRTPSHHVVEVLAAAPPDDRFDVVMLDTEHAPFELGILDSTLAVARALGVPTLVRVHSLERHPIQQALDLGAAGIVVPHVDSVVTARQAVRLAHYGDGGRGFSPSTRSAGWGTRAMADILDDAAASTTVVIQIEDPSAVDVIDDIVQVEGVDAVLIGRADLTVALGARGGDDERVVAAVERVAASCRDAALAFGVVVSHDEADDRRSCLALGATLILEGTDQSRLH
jgi:2-keto-3-deoxy-L-rhamnonate aldolase RhmA